jgi:hypothetical protein
MNWRTQQTNSSLEAEAWMLQLKRSKNYFATGYMLTKCSAKLQVMQHAGE